MQITTVSKSKFKAKALEYFRIIQKTGQPMLVTHDDKPVIKVTPFKTEDSKTIMKKLGEAITFIGDIESPVGVEDWEVLK